MPQLSKLIEFIKNNRTFSMLTGLILTLAIYFRFAKLISVITFGHDNSRDIIMVYKMFKYGEMIYQGPVFSVIWGFLSPLYFYLLAPFFYITNFNPMTAGILMILVNIISLVILMIGMYIHGGKVASITTGVIYGLSVASIVQYGQGLNPSLQPIATILLVFSILNIIKGKTNYLILVSICISSLLSFHPSGFFLLIPLILLFFIYKPRFKVKVLAISAILTGTIFALPYAIQEKKFNFINTKKLVEYIKISGTENVDQSYSIIDKILSPFSVVTKNISILITDEIYKGLALLGGILIISLVWHSIKFYKHKTNTNLLAFIIFLYLLSFGFILNLEVNNPYDSWMFAISIPLIVMYLGFWFEDIYKTQIKYIVPTILILFSLSNIYTFKNLSPDLDSYKFQIHLVNLIRSDSNGADFDVYGSQREPIYYMMWYTEENPEYKESYYGRFKWGKDKGSPLVYYLERDDKPLTPGAIDEINNAHRVTKWEELEYLEEFGVKIHRAN